jgi:hypothetical protein
MNLNRIYGVTNGGQTPIDLMNLRSLLPSSPDMATKLLSELSSLIEKEKSLKDDSVVLEVTEGTYIHSIQFLNRERLVFRFNEGSDKEVSQKEGVYTIGEHVYQFSSSKLNSLELNFYALKEAMKLLKVEHLRDISNEVFVRLIYDLFPKVRKGDDDRLYGIHDSNGLFSRFEHFSAHRLKAMRDAFSSLPDYSYTVALIDHTRDSQYVMCDLIARLNVNRKNKLTVVSVEHGELSNVGDYVIYVKDVWNSPSMFKHKVKLGKGRYCDVDEAFDRAVAKDAMYVSEYSTLFTTSYKPVLDIMWHDITNSFYRQPTSKYRFAQWVASPHKPWTLIALTIGPMVFMSPDSSEQEMVVVARYRMCLFRDMISINLKRNLLLCRTQDLSSYEGCVTPYINEFFVDLTDSYLMSFYDEPVWFTAKKIRGDVPPVPTMIIKLPGLLDMMQCGVWYNYLELAELGWNEELITRGVFLGVLTLWRDSTNVTYKRYDPPPDKIKRHFSHYEHEDVTILNSDGSITPSNSRFDSKVVLKKQESFDHNGQDFSLEIPSHSRFDYTSSVESNVDYVDSVVKKRRRRNKKVRLKPSAPIVLVSSDEVFSFKNEIT